MTDATTLVLGLGVAGRAALDALVRREFDVVAVDDAPGGAARQCVDRLGVKLVEAPAVHEWPRLLGGIGEVVMGPGVPDAHPCHAAARAAGVPVVDESDLAARWDDRPRCAVTGTNGKTTVVTLVSDMLERSGIRTLTAGNTDTPLVAAIDDTEISTFVVEASSFRLGHADVFKASPAGWLNFAPDHLDVHADVAAYEAAKARIFEWVARPSDAVANAADSVVMAHAPEGALLFGGAETPCRVDGRGSSALLIVDDEPLVEVAALTRSLPHDLDNAQAAAALAIRSGASRTACAEALVEFVGLAHRMALVAEVHGVRFVDDSKATTPHATLAAMAGLPGAVLIAGGRNKGVDLAVLGGSRPRAVVAIGEAAVEIVEVFTGRCPVHEAASMEEAVALANGEAGGSGTVLLSPGCSSFDWYGSYVERGRDFGRIVRSLAGSGA
jgi:UDP-N-acetylmuramoylalanine--D-glutamate ligase